MNDIVLYCKSYRRDVLRVRRLIESIERHNREGIAVYVSMPAADRALFAEQLGSGRCTLIDDEEIVRANPRARVETLATMEGQLSQAIVKAEFWRLGLAANYLCIDADSQFLADFRRRDFVAPDGDCYTVIHQNKDLLQLAEDRGARRVVADFHAEIERFRQVLPREGPMYYFAPSPFLWSAKVWASLDERYLRPRGLTIWQAVTRELPESMWYGESLLAWQAIPMRPIEPLFRTYHYHWQYYAMRRLGETEEKVARHWMGVIYQSNWQHEMDYGVDPKPLPSRMLRSAKRGLRYLQNRWL